MAVITISMPIQLADEIDAMRHEDAYGVSEIYLKLIREGLQAERKRRRAAETMEEVNYPGLKHLGFRR